jgi:hypothetical protein
VKLHELLDGIVYDCLHSEKAWDQFRLLGINPNDWPDSIAKTIITDYLKIRNAKNHIYAALKLEDKLKQIKRPSNMPPIADLPRVYIEAVNQAVAIELGKQLVRYPEKGLDLIQAFKFISPNQDAVHLGTNLIKYFQEMKSDFERGISIRELPGWPELSQLIGGFNPGRVGLGVAKTGFGKTTWAASLALSASEKFSTLFLNMEMSEQDFAQKLIMSAAGITYREIKGDPADIVEKLETISEKLVTRPLFFTQGKTLSVNDIEAIVQRYKETVGLDLVIIDYDQKIEVKTSKESPEWKSLQIAVEKIEAIAKRHEVYCLLLAQEAGDGDGKLSGSKRSAFPASTVFYFHQTESDDFVISLKKNRFGPTDKVIEVDYIKNKGQVFEKGIYAKKIRSDLEPMGSRNQYKPFAPRRYSPGD